MDQLTNSLFRAARLAAWMRAIGKLLQGNPAPLFKRIRDKAIYQLVDRVVR